MPKWMPEPRPKSAGADSPAAPGGSTQAQRDALGLIRTTLATYGLPDSLADWAWGEIVAGKGVAEVLLDLQQRPEFKAEFPEIEAVSKLTNRAPLSAGDIVSYRNAARETMRAAGFPADFYDTREDFSNLIIRGVSAAELNQRISQAREATYGIPEAAKRRLGERWGVQPGSGMLTAFFLDPDKALPLIQRDVNAAKIAGRADMAGFGGLTQDQAGTLADAGVSDQQAAQGFGELAQSSELFASLDRTEDIVDTDTQLGAVFSNNAAAAQRIERRRAKRKAAFAGGGGFAEGQRGVAGLGSVNS